MKYHHSGFSLFALILAAAFLSAAAAPGTTTLCTVKDNKKAAVVFTTDDGFYNSIQFYLPLWKYYNLRGTVALVTGWVAGEGIAITDTPNMGVYHGSWSQWTGIVDTGYLDIGSHTQSHPDLTTCNATQLEFEINGSKQRIETNIPGYKALCMLCPSGAYNDAVIKKVQEQYYACRVIDHGYNSFSPTVSEIFRLKRQQILAATQVSEPNGWIDNAIATGTWVIEAFHGANGEGWEPPPGTLFSAHWAYVDSKASVLWSGTFSEVVKYVKERMAATVTLVSSDTAKISLQLSDTLPNGIFNYPLTLKTQVPASWTAVKVTQNGKNTIVIPKTESGTQYAYYDAVPDSGPIDLKGATLGAFTNVASGKQVTVSSIEAAGFEGDRAVDGNASTRWSSKATDREWLYVDLGDRYYVNRVILQWSAAFGTGYRIQVSDNTRRWTDLTVVSGGNGGTDTVGVSGNGRYLRISGMTRSSAQSGYSFSELEVYGLSAANPTLTRKAPGAPGVAPRQSSWRTSFGTFAIPDFDRGQRALVSLYDASGSMVRKATVGKRLLSLDKDFGLPKGVYLVHAQPIP
jgi:peptidoglycan/xylan/chitin deacetylase (PgdA/CDA1 family)